jgi:hypothetical protein
MKSIIVVISLIFSLTSALAGPGGGGGGIGTLPPNEVLKRFPLNTVSEIYTRSGYIRIIDIVEGYESVKGIASDSNNLLISPISEIVHVYDIYGNTIFSIHE